jgi:hypothetical protein
VVLDRILLSKEDEKGHSRKKEKNSKTKKDDHES